MIPQAGQDPKDILEDRVRTAVEMVAGAETEADRMGAKKVLNTEKKCFTVETRLKKGQFPESYMEEDMKKQSKLFRIVWKLVQESPLTQSALNTYIQTTYHVDKRTANTLIKCAKGRLNALKELKKLEYVNLEDRIGAAEHAVEKLRKDVDLLREKAAENAASEKELCRYRRLKKKLWGKKQRLNRLRRKLERYDRELKEDRYPVCWGTKKLFLAQYHLDENGFRSHEGWLNAFRKKRDSQVNFIGSADEPCGNQNCQLSYDAKSASFSLRVRKDLGLMKDADDKFFVIRDLRFGWHAEKLADAAAARQTPFTFRILRRRKKWYLQVIFTWLKDERARSEEIRNTAHGTIGLDFNSGFITLGETDYFGNLCGLKEYRLKYHGSGNRADSEMQETIAKIVRYAGEKKKPIVIEDLNFDKKKSQSMKASGKNGKAYNRMLNTLDHSRYRMRLENACFRADIKLIPVNPAYTSCIGEEKFGKRMKLNRHQAACYVIARKGQGFRDRYVKKEIKKKAG